MSAQEDRGAPAPAIVDCDLLEAAKENVQPLGTGRRVTALSTVLATPHAQRDAVLAAQRRRLREDVVRALGADADADASSSHAPDALEAYTRLVTWTLEHYPQGPSVDSGLLELLEEATRVLLHHGGGRWRAAPRYLRLWLLYAGFVDRPTVVYRFLLANEVGTGSALLYEEWAAVLERDGRRREADEAYRLGVERRAEPVERLRARYEEFQRRMMANAVVPAAAAPARAVLGSRSVARSSSASTPAPTQARRPGGIQVFVDPAGETAGAGNTWGELETRRARVKENVRETRTLGGTTVRGTGVKGAVCARIPVFRDPVGESAAGTRDEEGVLRLVPGSGSEMEALRKDPLKNYPGGGDG